MAEWTELVWEAPVTDRVEADCVYGNPKGTLDAACLNRIDRNIRYIKAAVDYYHVATSEIAIRDEEWLHDFYFKLEDMSRIQNAILSCYNANLKKPSSPAITLSEAEDGIDYILLNKMEQLLLDIKEMLENMVDGFLYAGDSYCGEFQIGG